MNWIAVAVIAAVLAFVFALIACSRADESVRRVDGLDHRMHNLERPPFTGELPANIRRALEYRHGWTPGFERALIDFVRERIVAEAARPKPEPMRMVIVRDESRSGPEGTE